MTISSRRLVRSRENLKSLYFHYHSAYGHQALQVGNLLWEASTHNVNLWSCGLARSPEKLKPLLSTTTISMTIKRGRMVTYLDYLLPIKSNDHIIMLCCVIMWQTKNIISPLPQCLWPQNLAGWWLTLSDSHT